MGRRRNSSETQGTDPGLLVHSRHEAAAEQEILLLSSSFTSTKCRTSTDAAAFHRHKPLTWALQPRLYRSCPSSHGGCSDSLLPHQTNLLHSLVTGFLLPRHPQDSRPQSHLLRTPWSTLHLLCTNACSACSRCVQRTKLRAGCPFLGTVLFRASHLALQEQRQHELEPTHHAP